MVFGHAFHCCELLSLISSVARPARDQIVLSTDIYSVSMNQITCLFVVVIFIALRERKEMMSVSGSTANAGVNCYRCRSQNYTERQCHDPFANQAYSVTENCRAKVGTTDFPARYCIKVHGVSEITGEEFIIRDCVMEQPDEECGIVHIHKDRIRRCISQCRASGCNGSERGPAPVRCWRTVVLWLMLVWAASDV